MTETAHTPLPWVANDKHSGANPWRIETDDGVWANDGWIIAECCGPDAEANARFIVQAVNSHHRLVEALRECGQAIEVLFETADDRVTGVSCIALDMLNDAAKNARAALKEAGRGVQ